MRNFKANHRLYTLELLWLTWWFIVFCCLLYNVLFTDSKILEEVTRNSKLMGPLLTLCLWFDFFLQKTMLFYGLLAHLSKRLNLYNLHYYLLLWSVFTFLPCIIISWYMSCVLLFRVISLFHLRYIESIILNSLMYHSILEFNDPNIRIYLFSWLKNQLKIKIEGKVMLNRDRTIMVS